VYDVHLPSADNYLSISPSHPGQLNLLPSVGWEMSTSQSAVMLCGWGVKGRYGSFHLWINVWVAGKTDLTRAIPERFRD